MSKSTDRPHLELRIPEMNAATAAWLLDLCGCLQQAIWRRYGGEVVEYWERTEPDQTIYSSPRTKPRKR